MHESALAYLGSQRICVIAVEMMDGAPHAATVHFAHTNDPVTLIFKTSRTYSKSEPLHGKSETRASVVVGSNEGVMQTLQMDGVAKLIGADDPLRTAYLAKFPEKAKKEDPDAIYFSFTPTWWRFTDWTLPEGKTIFTSES